MKLSTLPTITLNGHCPSKANRYRVAYRGGTPGIRIDSQTASEISFLQLQANQQRPEVPHVHPELRIRFWQRSGFQDRDNKLKTILDILTQARIIANDNVNTFNGRLVVEPSVLSDDERVEIWINPTA